MPTSNQEFIPLVFWGFFSPQKVKVRQNIHQNNFIKKNKQNTTTTTKDNISVLISLFWVNEQRITYFRKAIILVFHVIHVRLLHLSITTPLHVSYISYCYIRLYLVDTRVWVDISIFFF